MLLVACEMMSPLVVLRPDVHQVYVYSLGEHGYSNIMHQSQGICCFCEMEQDLLDLNLAQ